MPVRFPCIGIPCIVGMPGMVGIAGICTPAIGMPGICIPGFMPGICIPGIPPPGVPSMPESGAMAIDIAMFMGTEAAGRPGMPCIEGGMEFAEGGMEFADEIMLGIPGIGRKFRGGPTLKYDEGWSWGRKGCSPGKGNGMNMFEPGAPSPGRQPHCLCWGPTRLAIQLPPQEEHSTPPPLS